MAIEVVTRQWGNSVGVVLPKEFVKEKHIRANEKIAIDIMKKADLTRVFNSLERKISGQEFKDLVRKGWEN